ncbi:MAG: UDP-N-acetylglucosamine 1-carboxyvinyltransferase [Candidatus Dormibacteria bacterium]
MSPSGAAEPVGEDCLLIEGGSPLRGEVVVSGSKNAALPEMAAAILASGPLRLSNVPEIEDVGTMCAILASLGVTAARDGDRVDIDPSGLRGGMPELAAAGRMRASLLLLGPLLAATGEADLPRPGGDDIGARRIEQHVVGLRLMGAEVDDSGAGIRARATRLHGAHILLDMPTVTGTENLMMAAVRAEGITIISNAAREPHVVDLALCLNSMGARISGAGTARVVVEGVPVLHQAEHRVRSDYIEAGTFALAAAATSGDLLIEDAFTDDLTQLLHKLRQAGCAVEEGAGWVRVSRQGQLSAVDMTTWPHPGFATDLQSQYVALMTQAHGDSTVWEALYENRFRPVEQLRRLGARIEVEGRIAVVHGGHPLIAADLEVTDIRSGAALVIAGLCAEGTTICRNVRHLDRGYQNLVGKLALVGGRLSRRREPPPTGT